MRQIALDTETTGLDFKTGDRLIEIGAVEIVNRKTTGETYHIYLNPQREISQEAIAVHGITNEFVQNKPIFSPEIAQAFLDFVGDSELIIHNAAFDIGFLDGELQKLNREKGSNFKIMQDYCKITDSLKIANDKYMGSRNNLDALCKRLGIDNSTRQLHGALLDAQLLAEVYLEMTGGQTSLNFNQTETNVQANLSASNIKFDKLNLMTYKLSPKEAQEHIEYLENMQKSSGTNALWLADEQDKQSDHATENN